MSVTYWECPSCHRRTMDWKHGIDCDCDTGAWDEVTVPSPPADTPSEKRCTCGYPASDGSCDCLREDDRTARAMWETWRSIGITIDEVAHVVEEGTFNMLCNARDLIERAMNREGFNVKGAEGSRRE